MISPASHGVRIPHEHNPTRLLGNSDAISWLCYLFRRDGVVVLIHVDGAWRRRRWWSSSYVAVAWRWWSSSSSQVLLEHVKAFSSHLAKVGLRRHELADRWASASSVCVS
ncbi:unnamed protein product, partial [Musa banksii]